MQSRATLQRCVLGGSSFRALRYKPGSRTFKLILSHLRLRAMPPCCGSHLSNPTGLPADWDFGKVGEEERNPIEQLGGVSDAQGLKKYDLLIQ